MRRMTSRTFQVERLIPGPAGQSERLLVGVLILDAARHEGLLSLRLPLKGEFRVTLLEEPSAASAAGEVK